MTLIHPNKTKSCIECGEDVTTDAFNPKPRCTACIDKAGAEAKKESDKNPALAFLQKWIGEDGDEDE